MNCAMTPEEYEKFGHAMANRLLEHFDGFAIVGFHAGSQQPVIYTHASDLKTRCALSELLRIAFAQNASASTPPPPENGYKPNS